MPSTYRYIRGLPVVLLLMSFVLIADHSAIIKSTTFDETAHITAGYSDWHTADFRLNPQNGLFPQMWQTLPLSGYVFPETNQPAWNSADVWSLGHEFLHQQKNDVDSILTGSRRMNLILGVFLGISVFIWSKMLWGYYGGVLSLGLYSFSPLVIAHSRLATSDIAASLGFMLALYTLWRLVNGVSVKNILLAGAAMGFLALSKMSVVIMAPVVFLMLGMYLTATKLFPAVLTGSMKTQPDNIYKVILALLASLVISVAVIWLPHLYASTTYEFDWRVLDHMPIIMASVLSSLKQIHLLPESYLYGLAFVLSNASDRLVFAAGEFSHGGLWWFFPFAILVKTPLVTLVCISGAIFYLLRLARCSFPSFYNVMPLAIFVVVYMLLAIASGLNIGLRHLLPVYPMVFVACGILVQAVSGHKKLLISIVVALLALETLSVHPHYLSFFNQLSGGPKNGYRQLVDSSNDWGQDLPSLARWQKANTASEAPYLAYFGTANPESYGIKVKNLPGFLDRHYLSDWESLEAGTYVVSATLLQLVYQPPDIFGRWTAAHEEEYQALNSIFSAEVNQAFKQRNAGSYRRYENLRFAKLCRYLRTREPDEMIAYSMLVYHLSSQELAQALR